MKAQQSDAETSVEKRAQYERFDMTVCANGIVNVCNQSHNDDVNHTYSVNPAEGSCTCPAAKYHEGACKHQTAVDNRPLVVSAAEAASDSYSGLVTDGGTETNNRDDGVKEVGDTFVRTDLDEGEPEITYHTEPKHLGGATYARCESCGSESVEDSRGDTSILHDDDCGRSNGRERPTRSEPADFGHGEGGVDEL